MTPLFAATRLGTQCFVLARLGLAAERLGLHPELPRRSLRGVRCGGVKVDDDITDFSPAATWRRSPLSRDAIDRVLASSRLKLPIKEHVEALRVVLAKLADMMVFESLTRPAAAANVKTLSKAFDELIEAFAKILREPGWTANPPPLPPSEWTSAMVSWKHKESVAAKKFGRKADNLDAVIYPHLLAFYALAYNRKASYTLNGPTIRFLIAFFVEMTAAFDVPQSDETFARAVARWKVPSPEYLREKVRTFIPVSLEDAVPEMLLTYMLNPFDLPSRGGEKSH